MQGLRLFLIVIWVVLLFVSWRAAAQLGLAAGDVFITDFSHPWRAQFNTDLSLHLMLFAIWIVWRESSKRVGVACAVFCAFGGVFTFAYLFASILRSGGDARALLLGRHV